MPATSRCVFVAIAGLAWRPTNAGRQAPGLCGDTEAVAVKPRARLCCYLRPHVRFA